MLPLTVAAGTLGGNACGLGGITTCEALWAGACVAVLLLAVFVGVDVSRQL
jgi:hypothetical protein